MDELNFTQLKEKLVSKGFKQSRTPYRDHFSRKRKYPWWKFWLHGYELVIVHSLVWGYEKQETDLDSVAEYRCFDFDQKSLEDLLEAL